MSARSRPPCRTANWRRESERWRRPRGRLANAARRRRRPRPRHTRRGRRARRGRSAASFPTMRGTPRCPETTAGTPRSSRRRRRRVRSSCRVSRRRPLRAPSRARGHANGRRPSSTPTVLQTTVRRHRRSSRASHRPPPLRQAPLPARLPSPRQPRWARRGVSTTYDTRVRHLSSLYSVLVCASTSSTALLVAAHSAFHSSSACFPRSDAR